MCFQDMYFPRNVLENEEKSMINYTKPVKTLIVTGYLGKSNVKYTKTGEKVKLSIKINCYQLVILR